MSRKLAVIVPYRNREEHLQEFIRTVPKFLQQQSVSFRIGVIHQCNEKPFNRAALLNIGAKLFLSEADYFCFHDVDLMPEECDYSYDDRPIHLSRYCSQFEYRTVYPECFGGVSLVPRDVFVNVNGFSNLYLGWGGEDDDFYCRLLQKDYRPGFRPGRFRSLPHRSFGRNHPHYTQNRSRVRAMRRRKIRAWTDDGFNQLEATFLYGRLRDIPLSRSVRRFDVEW